MKINTDKLYEELGFCGCTNEVLAEAFQIVLDSLLEADRKNTCYYYTDLAKLGNLDIRLVELILLELDRLEITEHGTSIRGSWLHDKEKLEKICGESKED